MPEEQAEAETGFAVEAEEKADTSNGPDLNHNGIAEEIFVSNNEMRIWENSKKIAEWYVGSANVFLYTLDEREPVFVRDEDKPLSENLEDFRNVIDEYLLDCEERNVEPEQPYKGTFNIRISPELHRNIAIYAIEHGKSLNAAVEEAIGNMVQVSLEKC